MNLNYNKSTCADSWEQNEALFVNEGGHEPESTNGLDEVVTE